MSCQNCSDGEVFVDEDGLEYSTDIFNLQIEEDSV